MGDQCFSIMVPNSNVTLSAGAGAVDGLTFTTEANAFHHSAVNSITEAGADARIVAGAVFGAVAGDGVLIGTPCTIQASAGGGVQIYAGAGISPSLGSPSGPGDAFGPSSPAEFEAGAKAEYANRFNDGLNSIVSIADAQRSLRDAKGFKRAKAYLDMARGGWDAAKAAGASNSAVDGAGQVLDAQATLIGAVTEDDPLEAGLAFMDYLGKSGGLLGEFLGVEGGAGLGNATAPTRPTCTDGAAGGTLGAPGDGPRIHQVAPGNIDRKCGAHMTAAVAGNKTTQVDGKIEYQSGSKIEMKAFSKVATQSLFFEAHANVSSKMVGFAQAKVESLGKAVLEGKAKFEVSTSGKGKVEAKGKLDISTDGVLDMGAKGIMKIHSGGVMALRGSSVGVSAKGRISATAPNIELKGKTKVTKDMEIVGNLKAKATGTFHGKIKGKKGGSVKGTVTLG